MAGVALKASFVDHRDKFRKLRKATAYALMGGLNDGGRKVFTRLRKQLRSQTRPKKYSTITSRTWATSATLADLSYVMRAKDEPIDVAEFGAKLVKSGVRAAPWGKARVFARSFQSMRRKSERNTMGFVARLGEKRHPVRALHGPNLAREFLGLTPGSDIPGEFHRAVRDEVPKAIKARFDRAMMGLPS